MDARLGGVTTGCGVAPAAWALGRRPVRHLFVLPVLGRLTPFAGPSFSFTLIFGSLVDTLGSGKRMSDVLRPIILWFCYLAVGAAAAGTLEIGCFELTGMRQANRVRKQYLTALLRQEVAYFDTNDTGVLLARVVADTNAIQEAISAKMPNFIHHFSAGIIGIIIGIDFIVMAFVIVTMTAATIARFAPCQAHRERSRYGY
jgi:ABC-type multidrug transport system fused ATPase/permease subunit